MKVIATKPSGFFRSLLCAVGIHGPNWYGNESHDSSYRDPDVPFNRTCSFCGEQWYGTQVFGDTMRYLGDWKTKEELIETGEWAEMMKRKARG